MPAVSESQRRAMFAAKAGNSTLGIPQSVGAEFANSDPGGKLPEKAKDMSGTDWNSVFTGLMKLVKFFKEEQQEPEHQTAGGSEPLNEREQPGLDAPPSEPPAKPAAGVAFITPRGDALFVRRVKSADHGGSWAFPGGWSEEKEKPHETAAREAKEEVGDDCTLDRLELADSRVADGVEYHTFRQGTPKRFTPRLNDEATEHRWSSLSAPPEPLHPGVKATLDKWREDESEDELSSAGALAAHHTLKARGLDLFEEEDANPNHDPHSGQFSSSGGSGKTSGSGGKAHAAPSKYHEAAPHPFVQAFAREHDTLGKQKAYLKTVPPEKLHTAIKLIDASGDRGALSNSVKGLLEEELRNREGSKDGISSAGALAAHHTLKARGLDEPEETKKRHEGELSETTRQKIGTVGSEKREDMPDDVFLQPAGKKYPVKEKRDGEWKYTRGLLLAAARRARMNHEEELAKRADAIREREFGSEEESKDALSSAGALAAAHKLHAQGLDGALAHDEWIGYDREIGKNYDTDGRLHVDSAIISKACVNPYTGQEINQVMDGEPGWKMLDPHRTYAMLRHPDELKKAVDTYNGLPLLWKHEPTSAEDHPSNLTIGASGTDAVFEDPFLRVSLVIWPKYASDAIDSGEKKQISAGYAYKADMSPGIFRGTPYDGVMRNLRGNHIAMVQKGRVGSEAAIDELPNWEKQWEALEKAIMALAA